MMETMSARKGRRGCWEEEAAKQRQSCCHLNTAEHLNIPQKKGEGRVRVVVIQYHKYSDVTVCLQEDVWISFQGTEEMDKRLPSRHLAAGFRFTPR